jgi:transcriptional regulator with XRE-family HTH domain
VQDALFTGDLDLASVTTPKQLAALLRTVHVRADSPSLRTLEASTRHNTTPLLKTTVSEMLRGLRFPRKAVMVAFLRACGVQDEHIEPWRRAWERVATPEAGSTQDNPVHAVSGGGTQTASSRAERPYDSPLGAGGGAQERQVDAGPAAGLSAPGETETAASHREQLNRLDADNDRPRTELEVTKRQPGGQQAELRSPVNMPTVRSPTVRRRELGALLRALRTEKGLTVEQVAERLLCSTSKVSRMETGHGTATLRDIRDLCDVYVVTDKAERDRMMQLAREGKQQGWWQSYDLDFGTYVGLEADAITIRRYQSTIVPGLLQTHDYARVVHEVVIPEIDRQRVDELVEVRMRRQQLLTQDSALHFWVVLDEAVLHRVVGGPVVMSAQLDKLIRVTDLPNVTIQVIPFGAGAHPAMESTFSMLDFDGPVPSVVYVEGLVGWIYIDNGRDITRYQKVFERLCTIALNPRESIELITRVGAHIAVRRS